jgi:uncharacterized Zn finger protein
MDNNKCPTYCGKCPTCGSDHFETGRIHDELQNTGILFQEVECVNCGSEWRDIYTLTATTHLVTADGQWRDSNEGPFDNR